PFLGTALGFAFAQSPAIILSMFVAIAGGMSAPYLLLCAYPAWLRFLPKPGPWMLHLKQFMGFLLLATLLFLLYVLGAQRGLEGAIWASCFLLIISIACWTNGDPVITKLLQQFGRPGVPLYVLYPGKSEEPIVFPELLTKSIILEKLETAPRAVAAE